MRLHALDQPHRLAFLEKRIADLECANARLEHAYAELVYAHTDLEARHAIVVATVIEKDAVIAGMAIDLEKSRKETEQWRRGFRERRARRSSRPEKRRPRAAKTPGRKKGHPGAFRAKPARIDGTIEHPCPEHCSCGGGVDPTGETESTIVVDIPPVRVKNIEHVAPVGRCRNCGKRVHAPLPGDVAAGTSVAKVQAGDGIQALTASLRFDAHVTYPKIRAILSQWFDYEAGRSGLIRMMTRLARRSAPVCAEIEQHIRSAPIVGVDETTHRQNGVSGYVWIARTPEAVLYRIELSRAAWVIDAILGAKFPGIVVSDFYSVYTSHEDWIHAYCWPHLLRDAKKVAEVTPCPTTIAFRERLLDWYVRAKRIAGSGDEGERLGIHQSLGRIAADPRYESHPDTARLQTRVHQRFQGLLTFVDVPGVPGDNNGTERDARFAVIHRKVTGGTRSAQGSMTQANLMSVTKTLARSGATLQDFIPALNAAWIVGTPLPSVFRPPRRKIRVVHVGTREQRESPNDAHHLLRGNSSTNRLVDLIPAFEARAA